MEHSEFKIGGTFWLGEKPWRCTDIGSRTIIAISLGRVKDLLLAGRLEEVDAASDGWFNGPPYAVVEIVLDESDLPGCSLSPEDDGSHQ